MYKLIDFYFQDNFSIIIYLFNILLYYIITYYLFNIFASEICTYLGFCIVVAKTLIVFTPLWDLNEMSAFLIRCLSAHNGVSQNKMSLNKGPCLLGTGR